MWFRLFGILIFSAAFLNSDACLAQTRKGSQERLPKKSSALLAEQFSPRSVKVSDLKFWTTSNQIPAAHFRRPFSPPLLFAKANNTPTTLSVEFDKKPAYGVRIELYNKTRYLWRIERATPYAFFGDNAQTGILTRKLIANDVYTLRVGICSAFNDTKCSWSALLLNNLVIGTAVVPPTATATAVSTPTPRPTTTPPPPTPTATPLPVGDFATPSPRIFTMEDRPGANTEDIVGMAPLTVHVSAVSPGGSLRSRGSRSHCVTDFPVPTCVENGQQKACCGRLIDALPVNHPTRLAWYSVGEQRKACWRSVRNEIAEGAATIIGDRRSIRNHDFQFGSLARTKFAWNFGDSNDENYSSGQTGFNAATVYDHEGTYTITLTVTNEAGLVGMTTRRVRVLAPQRRLIYVSADGNDNNANPNTPQSAIRTMAQLNRILGSGQPIENVEVRFRRGDTFELNNCNGCTKTLDIRSATNVVLTDYGENSAAKPRILSKAVIAANDHRHKFFAIFDGSKRITIQNMILRVASGTAEGVDATKIDGVSIASGSNYVTVRNVAMSQVYTAVYSDYDSEAILVRDNTSTIRKSLGKYFVSAFGPRLVAIQGNYINGITGQAHAGMFRIASQAALISVYKNRVSDDGNGCIRMQDGILMSASKNLVEGPTCGAAVLPLGGDIPNIGDGEIGTVALFAQVTENIFNSDGFYGAAAGTYHVLYANNTFERTASSPAITIYPYRDLALDSAHDISIVNNSFLLKGTFPSAVAIGDRTKDVYVANNAVFATNYSSYWESQSSMPMTVDGSVAFSPQSAGDTMTSIRAIGGNLFPLPGSFNGSPFRLDNPSHRTMRLGQAVTPNEWNSRLSNSRQGLGTDSFGNESFSKLVVENVFDKEMALVVPQAPKACMKVPFVSHDYSAQIRKNPTAQGAVELF